MILDREHSVYFKGMCPFSRAGSAEWSEKEGSAPRGCWNKQNSYVPWTLSSLCLCVLYSSKIFCVEKKKQVNVLLIRTLKQKYCKYMQCVSFSIWPSPELRGVSVSWLDQKLWLPCYISRHVALPLERGGREGWLKPARVNTCTCNLWVRDAFGRWRVDVCECEDWPTCRTGAWRSLRGTMWQM